MKDDGACYRCGECCKISACMYGTWGEGGCIHLIPYEEEGLQLYSCGLYDEIVKDPTSWISPAFGAGCCRSLFNFQRQRIMRKLR